MSLCLPDFEYNNSTGLCDKFEIIPPTDCTASNNQYNKNFLYNPVSKLCEYNDKTSDNRTGTITETSINNDPTCAPNTITLSNRQCKRLLVSIEPNKPPAPQPAPKYIPIETIQYGINQLPSQQALRLGYQVSQPAPQPAPQPIVRTTNYILYIFIFIIILLALALGLGIGYFYTRKKK